MKQLFWLSLVAIFGCSSLVPTSIEDPWQRLETRPTRVLILVLNGLDPDVSALEILPHFQRLKGRSLNFSQAWLGHLFSSPHISNMVLTSGLSPRHLPWNDELFWDRSGRVGKPKGVHPIQKLSSSELSEILLNVHSSLLRKIPGPPNSKLVVSPQVDEAFSLAAPTTESRILTGSLTPRESPETWVTDGILSFFQTEPQWKMVLASFGNRESNFQKSDEQLGRILDTLERKNLLKETLIVLTSHPKKTVDAKANAIFIKGQTPPGTLPSPLRKVIASEPVQAAVQDGAIRLYLKPKSQNVLLKCADRLKGMRGISEIFYKREISGRTHYIRTYRSESVEGSRLEWAKNQMPTLLNSLAGPDSADIIAFLEEEPQKVPLLLWSPNVRFDNPVIKNQIEQTRVRFVDIHPMILELMGISQDAALDGSSLGISSLVY